MSHPHYYASTSRNLDRVLQYGVFPFAYMAGLLWCRNDAGAKQVARFSGAAISSLLTSTFLGLESHTLDNVVREAVTAEMGIDTDKFKPSDCKYSKNIIAREGYTDFINLQPKRYAKDLLFLAPSLVEFIYTKKSVKLFPVRSETVGGFDKRKEEKFDATGKKYNALDIIANSHVGWDMAVYTGISAYWAYETFAIEKNSYYPIAQDLVGKIKPTEGNINLNHLIDIYQRTRNDQKLPMIKADDGKSHAALNYLLTIIMNAYNQHDGKMDIPEIVYLLGLNKIKIHTEDGKAVSPEAVLQSEREIDKVLTIGLDGIRAENKKLRENGMAIENDTSTLCARACYSRPNFVNPESRNRTFVDRFTDSAIKTSQSVLGSVGMLPKRPESYYSSSDPTELVGRDGGFGR